MENKNNTYLILTIILVILSVIGVFFIFQIKQSKNTVSLNSSSIPKIELIPTDIPITVTPSKIASPSPTKKPTITPTATPSAKITPTIKPTLTPTPTSSPSAKLNFSSYDDGFSILYNSTRKLYQDKETSGNRYTFTNIAGNFAIHVGLNDKWAWTNSDRQFSDSFLVAGKSTFRYDISTQTIVDLQSNGKNYTIQCIHNGKDTLKAECEQFLKDFQLIL
ncbi:MAG: hypothetical protein WC895_02045 [Candidatus Shapirobacteria bacterium]